jgi:hypothetical protein
VNTAYLLKSAHYTPLRGDGGVFRPREDTPRSAYSARNPRSHMRAVEVLFASGRMRACRRVGPGSRYLVAINGSGGEHRPRPLFCRRGCVPSARRRCQRHWTRGVYVGSCCGSTRHAYLDAGHSAVGRISRCSTSMQLPAVRDRVRARQWGTSPRHISKKG